MALLHRVQCDVTSCGATAELQKNSKLPPGWYSLVMTKHRDASGTGAQPNDKQEKHLCPTHADDIMAVLDNALDIS